MPSERGATGSVPTGSAPTGNLPSGSMARWGCAGLTLLMFAAISGGQAQSDDPLPLQRVVIPLSRLPAELERTRQGVLVQMPRDEFEDRVRRAARSGEALRNAPRLLKASYSAELVGKALVHGSGQWLVHQPGPAPAVLPLGGLNLALAKMRWAGAASGEAVVGDLDGKNLGLFVEKSGEVFFDWSLHGTTAADGLHFDLRVPPTAIAALELKMPVDCQVTVAKNAALLSGPHESGQANVRLWTVQFSGRPQVELVVRNLAETRQGPPLLLAQAQTRVHVRPEKVLADYDFQIEALHTAVHELEFECDGALQPYEVTAKSADIASWDFQDAALEAGGKKGEPARKLSLLKVQLRSPAQGPIQGLKIRCLSTRPAEAPAKAPGKAPDKAVQDKLDAARTWTCPAIRLRHGRSRAEALKLVIHPDVQLESWDPAGFRLLASTMDADAAQVLSLVDPAEGLEPSRRPACMFTTQGHDLHTRQRSWWQVGPQGSTLSTEIAYDMARGHMFQLAVRVPTQRWRVETVELEPKEALRSWSVAGPVLLVDLQRGLTARQPLKLSVRLTARAEGTPSEPRVYDIPIVEPIEATSRRGTLAVSADPSCQVALQKASAPPAPAEKDGPWGAETPQLFFQFRNKAVTGQVRLVPQQGRVRVRCQEEVTLGRGKGSVQVRLDLEPVLGNPDTLDLAIIGAGGARWKAEGAIVASLERRPVAEVLPYLLSLGAKPALGQAALAGLIPRHELWRLKFAAPLGRPETVTLHADLKSPQPFELRALPLLCGVPLSGPLPWTASAGALAASAAQAPDRWDIPLVTVPGAERLDAQVHLQPIGVGLGKIEAVGLEDVAAAGKHDLPGNVGRVLRYGPSFRGRLPHLTVTTQPHATATAEREWCDQAHLITYVDVGDQLLHCFRFHAWNWRQRELSVLLPAGKMLACKVDGRWLDQLPQVERPGGLEVTLPVGLDAVGHRFELYYATQASWSGWPTWAALDSAPPRLPGTPPTFRRTWRLAPGLMPLYQDHIRALSDVPRLSQEVRRAWHLGDVAMAEVMPALSEDGLEAQRLVLSGAEAALRRKLTRDMTVAEALDRLAHEFIKDQVPLVIDRAALRLADVRPDTPLGAAAAAPAAMARPFWESMGLVYVPFPSGPVLTTRQRLETWGQVYGRDAEVRRALDHGVAEAIARGHDARGRFASLGHWLRHERQLDPPPVALFLPATEGWTTWDQRPGSPDTARVIVVQSSSLRGLGIITGLLSVLLAWRIGRRLSLVWRFRAGTVWLAVLGLALLWLPAALQPLLWWPLVAAVAFLAAWLVHALVSRDQRPVRLGGKSTEKALKLVIGSSTALLLFVGGNFLACGQGTANQVAGQEPAPMVEPHTVLLVELEPGRQVAFVTPELLKALDDLEKRAASPAGAVLTSARYRGERQGNLAEFVAEFEVFSFVDKARLLVPLTGVELREGSYLDGAPVFPVAPPNVKSGYVVPIQGKGAHRLVLSFTVRPTAAGDFNELRFGIPKLCQSRLSLAVPAATQGLQLLSAFGERTIDPAVPGAGPSEADKTRNITAQLGREAAVQVRWRVQSVQPPATAAEVREAYYWDLRPVAALLVANLQFTPVKGNLQKLSVALPDDIDVRTVEATTGQPNAPSLVKGWSLTGKGADRQVHVDLTAPVAGRVVVQLSMAPRFNLAASQLLLRLPLPQKAKQTESFLAYRLEGWEAIAKTQNLGVTAIDRDVFARMWTSSGQKSPGPATQAFSFRRAANNAGLLLGLSVPKPQARLEAEWQVSAEHADLSARVRLIGTSEEVSVVELVLPPGLVLAEVRGPQVHHWNRQDGRVRIWLQQPRKEALVEFAGWVPLAQKVVSAKPGRFNLPVVQVAGAGVSTHQVKIVPAAGVILVADKVRNLTRTDAGFESQAQPYEGVFQVRPAPERPEVRILTTAEVRNQACMLTGHVHVLAPLGSPESFQVVLRNCPSDEARLDFSSTATAGTIAAGMAPRVQHRRAGADHVWDVTLAPNMPQPITLMLKARIPIKDGAAFAMPEVMATGVHLADRWVAVTGPGLRLSSQSGLEALKSPAKSLRYWPGAARHIAQEGTAWHVGDPQWTLTLDARAAGPAPPVTVLLAEEQAFLADGQRWVHQAEFLLAGRGDADVQLVLPAQSRLLALTVDDRPVAARIGPGHAALENVPAPEDAGPSAFWVPLGGPPGPRLVRLRWRYLPGAEALDRPHLGGVFLAGVPALPVHGRLLVPPGFGLSHLTEELAASQTQLLLARTRAYLSLSRFLANLPPGDPAAAPSSALVAAQRGFWSQLHQAELQTGCFGAGEDKAGYAAALSDLRKENDAFLRDKGLEALRVQADRQTSYSATSGTLTGAATAGGATTAFFVLPEQGTPMHWRALDPERRTTVGLVDLAGADGAWTRHRADFLVLIALSLLTLSFLPRGLGYLALLWPELCLLLALFGTLTLGPSLLALLLAAAGLVARLYWLAKMARRFVHALVKPKPQPTA